MFTNIKKYFIAGTLILLPLLITLYILVTLFQFADGILGKFVNSFLDKLLGFYIPGLGLVLFLIIIFLVGFITTHFLGRKLYSILERAIRRFPLTRHIYSSIKQIIEFLFGYHRPAFKRVVLVEYPRRGIWSIGFVTNENFQEAKEKTGEDLLNIFIPSSPGPLTGFFILAPRNEAILLDIAIEDAIKLLVSGGLINPVPITKKLKASQG